MNDIDLTQGRYDIGVIDPPWKFSSNSKAKPGRNAQRHYECMKPAEIIRQFADPMHRVMADESLLFMWVTVPLLPVGLKALDAFGFKYISSAAWDKQKKASGYWFRNEHEIILLGKRGRFPRPENKAPFNWSMIRGDRRAHSEKPEFLQHEINRNWPNARKIEFFARRPRAGWTVWGNQTTKNEGVI